MNNTHTMKLNDFFFASAFVFNSFSSVPKLKSKAYAKAQQKIQKFVIGISLSSAKYRDFKALAAFKVIDMNAISKKKNLDIFSVEKKRGRKFASQTLERVLLVGRIIRVDHCPSKFTISIEYI